MTSAAQVLETIDPATGEVIGEVPAASAADVDAAVARARENMPNPLDVAAPWGGVKASGWGREMGKDAIDLYTEVRSVWVSLS